jgi:hypothetical protein
VIILILEHAFLSHAPQSKPTRDEALDWAYSRYCASGVHNEVTKQFSESLRPKAYSILQFTEFILKHRLWYLYFASPHTLFHLLKVKFWILVLHLVQVAAASFQSLRMFTPKSSFTIQVWEPRLGEVETKVATFKMSGELYYNCTTISQSHWESFRAVQLSNNASKSNPSQACAPPPPTHIQSLPRIIPT